MLLELSDFHISFFLNHYYGLEKKEAEALCDYIKNCKDYNNFDLVKWYDNTIIYILKPNNDIETYKDDICFNEEAEDCVEYKCFNDYVVLEIEG